MGNKNCGIVWNISGNIEKKAGHILETPGLGEYFDYCFKNKSWEVGWRINATNSNLSQCDYTKPDSLRRITRYIIRILLDY